MDSNINAEIAIVGGGFTGLWTAWFIKQLEPALDVALLEQGVVGYGASGRNAGMISNCIDHSHALAVAHFGLEEARKLAQIGLKNIQELTAFAQDCDLELTGQLQFALTPEHTEECAHNVKIATELGIQGYRFLSAEEARNEINSALYLGAVYIPGGGIIDPIKLVDRLKSSTAQLGVRFYERTKVLKIDGGKLQTDRGAVSAGKVILATDAYTHHLLPQLLWRYIPLYDYILVSDRLNADQLAAIGWRNRQGALDGKTFFNYYRLTADNRILWGSSEAMYYPPNRVDPSCDYSMRHFEDLRASFRRHFPPLADLAFPFAWGGPIASTTRLTPFFGACFGGRVIYGLGYTGHGIGSTRLAGKVLAHLALSRDSDLLKLKIVTNKPFPYPPEPLRALAVQAVTRSLRKKDNGQPANMLLKLLDALGIGFSS
jgi:glycine/D-amino acid oxidase-like deaminating enzyme